MSRKDISCLSDRRGTEALNAVTSLSSGETLSVVQICQMDADESVAPGVILAGQDHQILIIGVVVDGILRPVSGSAWTRFSLVKI